HDRGGGGKLDRAMADHERGWSADPPAQRAASALAVPHTRDVRRSRGRRRWSSRPRPAGPLQRITRRHRREPVPHPGLSRTRGGLAATCAGSHHQRDARGTARRSVGRGHNTEGRTSQLWHFGCINHCRMSEPISPPPVTDYKPEYIPAYLSNGLIGLRVGRIPPIQGLAIVNGLAAIHPADEVEGFSRAPY